MNRIENGIYRIHRSSTETHNPIHYGLWGGKDLKRILTCLYCNKWNKINIWDSDTQKHFANKKWFKCYKYFVYRLTQKISDPNRGNV